MSAYTESTVLINIIKCLDLQAEFVSDPGCMVPRFWYKE
jgi:hypothetical protein